MRPEIARTLQLNSLGIGSSVPGVAAGRTVVAVEEMEADAGTKGGVVVIRTGGVRETEGERRVLTRGASFMGAERTELSGSLIARAWTDSGAGGGGGSGGNTAGGTCFCAVNSEAGEACGSNGGGRNTGGPASAFRGSPADLSASSIAGKIPFDGVSAGKLIAFGRRRSLRPSSSSALAGGGRVMPAASFVGSLKSAIRPFSVSKIVEISDVVTRYLRRKPVLSNEPRAAYATRSYPRVPMIRRWTNSPTGASAERITCVSTSGASASVRATSG